MIEKLKAKNLYTRVEKEFWPQIEAEIRKLIDDDTLPPIALEMIEYQFKTGGKRVRPLLALLLCDAYGADLKHVYPFAATVELIHNASVVHDDLQDKDTTRRGLPSVWSMFTAEQAINLGDILFILGFELLYRLPIDAQRKLDLNRNILHRVNHLVQGQILEFHLKKEYRYRSEDYFQVAEKKTASLFALATKGTGMIIDLPEKDYELLDTIGIGLGSIFQIRDDIIDLLGEKEGRPAGSDILEGKITLPFAIYLENNPPKDEMEKVAAILQTPRPETKQADVDWVLKLFQEKEILAKTLKVYSDIEDNKVLKNLDTLGNKTFKQYIEILLEELGKSVKEFA